MEPESAKPAKPSKPSTPRFEVRHLVLGIILVFTLGLRSCNLVNHVQGPLAKVAETAASSDMHAFTVWARKMANGDWLCRDTYHPYMDWMEPIAPLEKFEEWWGGKEIYHQNPLFPYMLAVSYVLSDSEIPLLVLQVLLSTLSVYLIYDIGRRLFDVRAGLIAAGMAAVFAPSVVLDVILLRASLNSSMTLLSVWLLLRVSDRSTPVHGIAAGACLAASYLLRPTGLALMLVGPLILLLIANTRRQWVRWLPALLLGIVAIMAPFVARNLIVGAPALRFSTRGPETVLQANCKNTDPGFMTTPSDEDYKRFLEKGPVSIGQALSTAIDTWPGDSKVSWWLWHEWQKVICVFGDYEYQNNINFYYYRRTTTLLKYLPTFGWFVGLGLVGIVLMAFLGRQRVAALIPLAALGALLLGSILGFALGRYRMPLAMLMTIPAAATVSLAITWYGQRKFVLIGTVLLSAVLLSIMSVVMAPASIYFLPNGAYITRGGTLRKVYEASASLRPQEACVAARALYDAGDKPAAMELLQDYMDEYLEFANSTGKRLGGSARSTESLSVQELLYQALQLNMNFVANTYFEMGEEKLAGSLQENARQMGERLRRLRGQAK